MYTKTCSKKKVEEKYSDIDQEGKLTELYNAVCGNDNVLIVELIKTRPHLINRPCVNWEHGGYELPLAAAVRLKQDNVAFLLISYGSKLETKEQGEGITPLQWASSHGNVVLMEVLLKNGADINHKGPNNNTALHYAVLYEQLDSVVCLLENGAVQTLNNFNFMPIHLACLKSVTPIVKQFLKVLKKASDFLKDEYVQAFETVCVNGGIEVAKMWLSYFEMNFSDYVEKAHEFMQRVNFFKILKEWVDMFEAEDVGDGQFEDDYWRHQQILMFFLSYDIKWTLPADQKEDDEASMLRLFLFHPYPHLIKNFLTHCPIKTTKIPCNLIRQVKKHISFDETLVHVFRLFKFQMKVLPSAMRASEISPFARVEIRDLNSDTLPTYIPLSEKNLNTIEDIITPLLSLQESCRLVIRQCLAGSTVCNILFKLPQLELPVLLKNYLIFKSPSDGLPPGSKVFTVDNETMFFR